MNREFSDILDALGQNREAFLTRTAEGETYTRAFSVTDRLILLGGGHVAQAVARFAGMLDFAVTVVDDRPAFANRARFPEAAEIVCEPFADAIRSTLHICKNDYVCVLTRGHRWDADCLRAILPGEMPHYLGMIGSRRRVSGLKDILTAEGFDPERLARLHAPIGLPIRAQTPEEIAISILAEMIQTRRAHAARQSCLSQRTTDLDMLRRLAAAETPMAMILVLETRGSTPAKDGAMMAVDRAGRTFGNVGGGCSEGEALRKAVQIIEQGGSEILSVSLLDDVAGEEGMVCGGTMKLLIERVASQEGSEDG